MRFLKNKYSPINPPMYKGRLETLSDGIFAIAMTLLVLGIELPATGFSSLSDFIAYITLLIPQILIYFLSFILLAIFWLNHHILFAIKKANLALFWINIIWLMFIALVPFTTSLVSKFGQYHLSPIIFDLNIFAIGVLYYINWNYASKKGFITEKMEEYAHTIKKANLFTPMISLAAIGLSFINPYLSSIVFLFIPVIYLIYLKIIYNNSEN